MEEKHHETLICTPLNVYYIKKFANSQNNMDRYITDCMIVYRNAMNVSENSRIKFLQYQSIEMNNSARKYNIKLTEIQISDRGVDSYNKLNHRKTLCSSNS